MADLLAGLRAERARDQRTRSAVTAEQRAQRARAAYDQTSWRQPITRWRASKDLDRREAERAEAALTPEDLKHLANVLINRAVLGLRTAQGKYASTRHRLHHEVDAYWAVFVADVASEVATIAAQEGALPQSSGGVLGRYCPNDLAPLAELLTPEAVTRHLELERDIVRNVAADQEMATKVEDDGVLTVQHVASGLRATFTPGINRPGPGPFGSIFSKHYRIRDISPGNAFERDTEYFEGLGIGEKVYRHGASLFPGTRWPGGLSADSARELRRRLHNSDPYIWEGPCLICPQPSKDDKDWDSRKQSDFPVH